MAFMSATVSLAGFVRMPGHDHLVILMHFACIIRLMAFGRAMHPMYVMLHSPIRRLGPLALFRHL